MSASQLIVADTRVKNTVQQRRTTFQPFGTKATQHASEVKITLLGVAADGVVTAMEAGLCASRTETRHMSVRRVVLNIKSTRFSESRDFYVGLLGFELAMDMEWIMTFVSPTNPTAQVSVIKRDATVTVDPDVSIEAADVDSVYAQAQRRGDAIVYPLTDEPWGVRRFFVLDPNGEVISVLSHINN